MSSGLFKCNYGIAITSFKLEKGTLTLLKEDFRDRLIEIVFKPVLGNSDTYLTTCYNIK